MNIIKARKFDWGAGGRWRASNLLQLAAGVIMRSVLIRCSKQRVAGLLPKSRREAEKKRGREKKKILLRRFWNGKTMKARRRKNITVRTKVWILFLNWNLASNSNKQNKLWPWNTRRVFHLNLNQFMLNSIQKNFTRKKKTIRLYSWKCKLKMWLCPL